ncbi:hypothetical protein J6590_056327 [Homalodisca vitripennis]|nr:hypothetical protein J6590_056327 [Homalodisca vitripennis]
MAYSALGAIICLTIFSTFPGVWCSQCDDTVLSVVRTASAVFTGKVQALNGTGSEQEAVVRIKRVFRKSGPSRVVDNDARRLHADLGPGVELRVAVPPLTTADNDQFLVCFGIFSPLFSLRVRDTKVFVVKLRRGNLEQRLARNRDNYAPRFELLASPLPMSLANLHRVTLAVKGICVINIQHKYVSGLSCVLWATKPLFTSFKVIFYSTDRQLNSPLPTAYQRQGLTNNTLHNDSSKDKNRIWDTQIYMEEARGKTVDKSKRAINTRTNWWFTARSLLALARCVKWQFGQPVKLFSLSSIVFYCIGSRPTECKSGGRTGRPAI